jgi:cyclic beta-1,2-glucan synthetase
VVTRVVPPRRLPGMDLARGIPPELRCLVAVPVLLDTVEDVTACIERLEVHHLSSTDGALHYAILADGPDAETETRPQDAELIAHAERAVARLNAAYPSPAATGSCSCIAAACGTRRWASGWGGSASAAS